MGVEGDGDKKKGWEVYRRRFLHNISKKRKEEAGSNKKGAVTGIKRIWEVGSSDPLPLPPLLPF